MVGRYAVGRYYVATHSTGPRAGVKVTILLHASRSDTSSEPSGFIFLASGEAAFVNLQHRSVDAANHRGSLMMISGFKVKDKDKD
jgi:hypothetical protein